MAETRWQWCCNAEWIICDLVSNKNRKQFCFLCQCQLPNHGIICNSVFRANCFYIAFFLSFRKKRKKKANPHKNRTETNKYLTPKNTKCIHIGFGIKLQAFFVHKTNVYSRSGFHLFCYSRHRRCCVVCMRAQNNSQLKMLHSMWTSQFLCTYKSDTGTHTHTHICILTILYSYHAHTQAIQYIVYVRWLIQWHVGQRVRMKRQ